MKFKITRTWYMICDSKEELEEIIQKDCKVEEIQK